MEEFSIGDIEKITGIKTHILRYWEEVVPLLQPKKTLSGRRIYSKRDLDFIYRLNHLIYKKKYTAEGAAAVLLQDASFCNESIAISKLRNELLEIYGIIKNAKIK